MKIKFNTFLLFFYFQRFTEPQLVDQTVYIFIVIGALMFVLGFLGYCGALRESQCLLSLVSVEMCFILIYWKINYSIWHWVPSDYNFMDHDIFVTLLQCMSCKLWHFYVCYRRYTLLHLSSILSPWKKNSSKQTKLKYVSNAKQ